MRRFTWLSVVAFGMLVIGGVYMLRVPVQKAHAQTGQEIRFMGVAIPPGKTVYTIQAAEQVVAPTYAQFPYTVPSGTTLCITTMHFAAFGGRSWFGIEHRGVGEIVAGQVVTKVAGQPVHLRVTSLVPSAEFTTPVCITAGTTIVGKLYNGDPLDPYAMPYYLAGTVR